MRLVDLATFIDKCEICTKTNEGKCTNLYSYLKKCILCTVSSSFSKGVKNTVDKSYYVCKEGRMINRVVEAVYMYNDR